ncbi:hypothetical protein LPJ75_002620 [Coemansia sp. RSA 2598]|nr:hypothetical protein LPJ75_002620 [Coemansia sp. RSA 2598]
MQQVHQHAQHTQHTQQQQPMAVSGAPMVTSATSHGQYAYMPLSAPVLDGGPNGRGPSSSPSVTGPASIYSVNSNTNSLSNSTTSTPVMPHNTAPSQSAASSLRYVAAQEAVPFVFPRSSEINYPLTTDSHSSGLLVSSAQQQHPVTAVAIPQHHPQQQQQQQDRSAIDQAYAVQCAAFKAMANNINSIMLSSIRGGNSVMEALAKESWTTMQNLSKKMEDFSIREATGRPGAPPSSNDINRYERVCTMLLQEIGRNSERVNHVLHVSIKDIKGPNMFTDFDALKSALHSWSALAQSGVPGNNQHNLRYQQPQVRAQQQGWPQNLPVQSTPLQQAAVSVQQLLQNPLALIQLGLTQPVLSTVGADVVGMPPHSFASLVDLLPSLPTNELQNFRERISNGEGRLSAGQRKAAIVEIDKVLMVRANAAMHGHSVTQGAMSSAAPISMTSTVFNNQPIFVLQQPQPSVPRVSSGGGTADDDACVVCLSTGHSARACPLKKNKGFLQQRLATIQADPGMSDNKKFLAEVAIETLLKTAEDI